METIKRIEEVFCGDEKCHSMAGFEVETDLQTIKLLIGDEQDCCEQWGYLWCNDNPQDFVGTQLLGISIVDEALNSKVIEDIYTEYNDQIMFVNLETNIGLLQFVVYNGHNGYYAHRVLIKSEQLTSDTYL